MNLTSQKILVVGGAGFIGSHLVEYLIEGGRTVVVLDNFRNGSRANLATVAGSASGWVRPTVRWGSLLDVPFGASGSTSTICPVTVPR